MKLIVSKHDGKVIMKTSKSYPVWAFCFRWALLLLMLAVSFNLIKEVLF